ncbi:MAG: delta endotoxin C-terminal domain-containing protein, partial [Bdellovibrionota bacterium]
MQVLTLIRVLFFNLIFLFWASIAFSGVAHQIPSDLLADDYESSDKSVNIVVRNGVKELRFKKNQSVNFKVNLSKAGLYKVRVHYSSKGTTPQLNAKVNDGQKLDFNFEATPYNSDYVDRNIPEYFEFLYGEQIFTLKAKSDNFYLVRLEFIKVDYLYEKVPGEIRAGAFFKKPDPVTTYVRDGQQEIQFKKDQKIFYKLDVKEAGYYDLYLEYSSPNYNPLIRLDFQEASVDDSQLPKTSSASDFIDEATGHRIKLYPGYNEMEFLSMRAGFNLRKVEL